jgi:hypothetical protein
MNSPKSDMLLDDMFRDALQPGARVMPPADMWPRIVSALPSHESQGKLHSAADAAPRTSWRKWIESVLPRRFMWPVPVCRAPRWHKVVSWVHGYETVYPPSTTLLCLAPNGRCMPSSFAGVMVKQVLDLRLAS